MPTTAAGAPAAWDAPVAKEEPICKQTQHQKARGQHACRAADAVWVTLHRNAGCPTLQRAF
jgi:hypothetical protein